MICISAAEPEPEPEIESLFYNENNLDNLDSSDEDNDNGDDSDQDFEGDLYFTNQKDTTRIHCNCDIIFQ